MTEETFRFIDMEKIGDGRYKATNRRGGVLPVGSGDDPDFSPVELITGKRAAATSFSVRASGDKVRDDGGNHLTNLEVTFDITWPEGEDGDKAREVLPRTLAQVRDRLCTVSRTVALGEPVEYGAR